MENLSANVLSAIPELTYTLPWLGEVNFTPYLSALAIFVGLSLFTKIVLVVILGRLKHLSTKTSTDIDDVIINALSGVRAWVYTLVSFYVALQFFVLPDMLDKVITGLVLFAVAWQAIEVLLCFIDYGATRLIETDEDGDGEVDPNSATASHMVTLIARIVLWSLGIIFVMSNLGIEVTSLLAGLGIGGIAIAFALQGVLTDLFASFSIYFDKPFRIGDYIVLGTDSGTVEKIGIKSTRIRTLQGEELVVSNAELTTARVQNFKKMEERRISSQFGITYETPHDKVKEVNGVVERIFGAIDGARLDRVFFTTFGDSALIFELVFYVESAEYADFLTIQQRFNFELMDRFAELGIEFAYPTQMIYSKQV